MQDDTRALLTVGESDQAYWSAGHGRYLPTFGWRLQEDFQRVSRIRLSPLGRTLCTFHLAYSFPSLPFDIPGDRQPRRRRIPLGRQHRVCYPSRLLYPRMPRIANRPSSTRAQAARNAGTGSVTCLASSRIGQVANAGFPRWLLPVRYLSCIMGEPCQLGSNRVRAIHYLGYRASSHENSNREVGDPGHTPRRSVRCGM